MKKYDTLRAILLNVIEEKSEKLKRVYILIYRSIHIFRQNLRNLITLNH